MFLRRSDQTRILASPSPRWMFGENSMMFAIVSRGKNSGRRLLPHRYKDNRYHVSLGDEGPYIPFRMTGISRATLRTVIPCG
jgi:hypothetical protein